MPKEARKQEQHGSQRDARDMTDDSNFVCFNRPLEWFQNPDPKFSVPFIKKNLFKSSYIPDWMTPKNNQFDLSREYCESWTLEGQEAINQQRRKQFFYDTVDAIAEILIKVAEHTKKRPERWADDEIASQVKTLPGLMAPLKKYSYCEEAVMLLDQMVERVKWEQNTAKDKGKCPMVWNDLQDCVQL